MKYLGEMKQNISLRLKDVSKIPACGKGSLKCLNIFHYSQTSAGSQGLDRFLENIVLKGHLNNIIKLEGEKGCEEQ